MAVYFQLYREGSSTPSRFIDIDDAICHNLDIPSNDNLYAAEWYDVIGLRLALGRSFAEIADEFKENIIERPQYAEWYRLILRINHFLMENYRQEAWYAR